ncbi:putative diacylglycerol O-acyltransferase tgs1 [Exophiala xenobiotica]|nr:putative diacylglycerol O-acyltransferase tgs1 [Exophiala xenobiotica]KAK5230344.1 putative diacylglycerol O-acyltransferase tgs1 [Exophiala xenobiotica]KAK5367402.1 putative diacylglycerol O-acyltransferase tgs1 [Exophiala xenobiotica]
MAKKRKHVDRDEDTSQVPARTVAPSEPLPDGVHHYETIEEVPWDVQKYWHQGYSIFSKYDDGIWMTDNAWYGVTHESVANTIAQHVSEAAPPNRSIIIDAFCGVGGNTIAFALSGKWKRVYGIEKDAATLTCAKHNAEIYGVSDKITWFHGDCFEILGAMDGRTEKTVDALKAIAGKFGIIFASPPWGGTLPELAIEDYLTDFDPGPSYSNTEVFDLEAMEPYTFSHLYKSFGKVTPNMVLYLPRTSDLRQIAQVVDGDKKIQVVHYCTNGSSRALCTYLGDWAPLKLRSESNGY